jgi:hypothetical protein
VLRKKKRKREQRKNRFYMFRVRFVKEIHEGFTKTASGRRKGGKEEKPMRNNERKKRGDREQDLLGYN